MQWETPELTEISLPCEISGYENAELSAPRATVILKTKSAPAFRTSSSVAC